MERASSGGGALQISSPDLTGAVISPPAGLDPTLP
jgi:hypothetical protein